MTFKKEFKQLHLGSQAHGTSVVTPLPLPSNKLFQLESYPLAACLLDSIGKIQQTNEHWLELLGGHEEDWWDRPINETLSPVTPTPLEGLLANSQSIYAFQHTDERPITCRLTLLPLHHGEKERILAFLQPVVELTSSPALPAMVESLSDSHSTLYRRLIEQARDLIALHKTNGQLSYINPASSGILGFHPNELLGENPLAHLLHPEDTLSVNNASKQALTGQPATFTHRLLHKQGHYLWLETKLVPLFDESQEVIGLHSISRNVTKRKETEEKMQFHLERLEYLAQHDPLTGLPNRVLFQDRLEQAILHARRHSKMVAMLCFDLDRFQRINDTLGHSIGDRLLHAVANRLKDCIREGDTLTRPGGDEFAFILPSLEEPQEAVRTAQMLLSSLQEPFELEGHELFLTASVGISIYPMDGKELEVLLIHAYNAMYQAKEQGKNTFHLYTSAMNVAALERLAFENSLRRAVERDQLVLYYQPQVEVLEKVSYDFFSDKPYHAAPATTQYKIVGSEALLRWKHPELGLISPDRFIPVAEASGLIVSMGEWVIREACRQNKAWQDAGHPPIHISVNLSPWQFQRPNLVQTIEEILEETGMHPKYLELEITENVFVQNDVETRKKMQQLCDMGCSIAIDDFGTGYSSLLYLKKFPIQILKIDKSFIQNLSENQNDAAITKGIIALAHSLDLNVVAEGVQARNQLNYLRSLQCNRIQGYIFSRPVPADEFQELLQLETLLPHSPSDSSHKA